MFCFVLEIVDQYPRPRAILHNLSFSLEPRGACALIFYSLCHSIIIFFLSNFGHSCCSMLVKQVNIYFFYILEGVSGRLIYSFDTYVADVINGSVKCPDNTTHIGNIVT